MSNRQDDLDLLLSLQDRVLETPPGSPSHSAGYLSDDEFKGQRGPVDMSVFRDAVEDCLDYEPKPVQKTGKLNRPSASTDPEVEKFSGLRIRKQLITPLELNDHFSDIRFVRLSAIKNLLRGDTLSGCWATVGVLTEKANPKTSSTGKSYSIWKFGCLDEDTISVFLFGDAYEMNCKEQAGLVFALLNCTVRKDAMGGGFSLSVYSANQMLKMGTSVDYGVCKGQRKDGMACTVVINKRRGIYCKFHKSKESQKYSTMTMRTELNGGNLRTAFRTPHSREGIFMVDPLSDKTNTCKRKQPVKLLSVEGLKKALSNAGKVTTNTHSQGIRFLAEMTGKTDPKDAIKASKMQSKPISSLEKRKPSSLSMDPSAVIKNQQMDSKRMKTGKEKILIDKTKEGMGKMIELEYISSDEGF
ncbi:protein MCM10 homolog [Prunus avium]|uniref:Protein MCM10 homolog n=1 Tax=Prunus avium TaxID=42229 RepID=A0A6P5S0A4_PRUAV|nr:protein MCM10 homolog [Prunus avium]